MRAEGLSHWFFPVLGVLMLMGAGWSLANRLRFEETSLRATGVITDLNASWSRDSDRRPWVVYCPVFEFKDAQGETIQRQGGVCSSPALYDIGDTVDVLYSRTDSRSAVLDGFIDRWLVVSILALFGALFTGMGVLGMYMARGGSDRDRRRRRPRRKGGNR